MRRYDLIVVGAGPAGLSAATKAAECGAKVAIFDENDRPGGQLFKQIHKFFGSKEHRAKERGFRIGEDLLKDAENAGVKVHLNATVMGLYDKKEIMVNENGKDEHYKADAIVLACGARENFIPFKGWNLPGVMGAGAAQTMINIHGVKPGNRVLVVGSGNVGLVVSYQLMQAGMEVAAIVDAAKRVGGYGVHASKLTRMGVNIKTGYTITEAIGTECVEGAVIAQVDDSFTPVSGTEEKLDVDLICIAVGLLPMSELSAMIGCKTVDKGGTVPVLDEEYQSSVEGIFVAGDNAGIEEASSAMITGKIAGLSAMKYLGYVEEDAYNKELDELKNSLALLHEGMFAPSNKGRTDFEKTDEGYPFSQNLLRNGFITDDEIGNYPGVQSGITGIHPVMECTQNIPCNPCQDVCKFGCITVGKNITNLPCVNTEAKCTGCGMCVANCSGLAIFLVNEDVDGTNAEITLPYEFLPYPEKGDKGAALDRQGNELCEAEIVSFRISNAMDKTGLLTMRVPKEFAMKARFFKKQER